MSLEWTIRTLLFVVIIGLIALYRKLSDIERTLSGIHEMLYDRWRK